MKKMVMLLILTLGVTFTACGNKSTEEVKKTENTQTVKDTQIVKDTQTVKDTQMAEDIKDSISVEETIPEDKPEEAKNTDTEEIIGDVDISADSLSMADMQELEIGLDTPFSETDPGTSSVVDGFKVLFPGGAYITKTTAASSEVELDSIHFILSVTTRNEEAPTSAREDRGETLETIGNYTVLKIVNSDSQNSYGVDQMYHIYDINSGNAAYITIVINKKSDYQEYCDKLVDEYMPKFEEVLYSNLQ